MFDAAVQHESVTAIDLSDYFCDAVKCHAMIGGVMVYFDDHHLTGSFSKSLASIVADQIETAIPG